MYYLFTVFCLLNSFAMIQITIGVLLNLEEMFCPWYQFFSATAANMRASSYITDYEQL